MSSDDEFMSFSPPKEQSPQVNYRRLKRLKKSKSKSPNRSSLPDPINDSLLFNSVDFAKLEALENGSETLDFNDSNSSEDLVPSSQESLPQGVEEEECGTGVGSCEVVKKTKRVLEFDDAPPTDGFDEENVDLELEQVEKKSGEKKKKRSKSDRGGELKTDQKKARVPNKKKEEKERKAYLKELHAESQRLLRETSNAAFKPIPVVHKPISSVLEKIRKRKLEISKKVLTANSSSYGYVENYGIRDKMDLDVSDEKRREEAPPKTVEEKRAAPCEEGENILDALKVDGFTNASKQSLESDQDQAERLSLDA